MRLRPSGNSGLLVSTLDAFADYQREQAWTWEHQALVRARVVAGDPALAERFDALRREILGRERDLAALREEVVKMRHKMRDHLGSKGQGDDFDLKHDPGGMVDIEFLCQFAVLSLGRETPDLLAYSDNMRILETLEASGQLPAEESRRLREAYLACRTAAHRAALTGDPARGRNADFQAHRDAVIALWRRLLEPA